MRGFESETFLVKHRALSSSIIISECQAEGEEGKSECWWAECTSACYSLPLIGTHTFNIQPYFCHVRFIRKPSTGTAEPQTAVVHTLSGVYPCMMCFCSSSFCPSLGQLVSSVTDWLVVLSSDFSIFFSPQGHLHIICYLDFNGLGGSGERTCTTVISLLLSL